PGCARGSRPSTPSRSGRSRVSTPPPPTARSCSSAAAGSSSARPAPGTASSSRRRSGGGSPSLPYAPKRNADQRFDLYADECYAYKRMNPFSFGDLALDASFTDREQELAELAADLRNGQNVVVFAPRRYGKSSLLWRAAQLVSADGVLVAQ